MAIYNPKSVFEFPLHPLVAILTCLAIVFLIRRDWDRKPTPVLPRWVQHRNNLWIAICAAVAPNLICEVALQPLLASLFKVDAAVLNAVMDSDTMLLPIVIAAIQGVFYGFAASCCATSPDRDVDFGTPAAVAVSVAVILASYYGPASVSAVVHAPHAVAVILPPLMTIAIARLWTAGSTSRANGRGAETALTAHMENHRPLDEPEGLGCAVLIMPLAVVWAVVCGVTEVVVLSKGPKNVHFPFFTVILTFFAIAISTFRWTQSNSKTTDVAIGKSIVIALGVALFVCAGSFMVGVAILTPACSGWTSH